MHPKIHGDEGSKKKHGVKVRNAKKPPSQCIRRCVGTGAAKKTNKIPWREYKERKKAPVPMHPKMQWDGGGKKNANKIAWRENKERKKAPVLRHPRMHEDEGNNTV
jgi:hypothetical protein